MDCSGDGGVVKTATSQGNGKVPRTGDMVFVDYSMRLDDGTVVDSSIGSIGLGKKNGKPGRYFCLGEGSVLRGLEKGVAKMRLGEKATFKCSATYAYGATGVGRIPPNAALTLDVELLDSWHISPQEHKLLSFEPSLAPSAGLALLDREIGDLQAAGGA